MIKISNFACSGSLRREYFCKEEKSGAPLSLGLRRADRGAFSFGGHRLSSLYRDPIKTASWLRNGICAQDAISSLKKYSIPALAAGQTPGGTFI